MIIMPDGTVPPAGIQSKEVLVMMMMTMNNAFMNISTMLAEDAGAPELRNPLAGGMRAKGLLGRLFGRKNRAN
jgi:hypothetical protein